MRYQTFLSQSYAAGNDLDGSALPTTASAFTYDAYNNATQIAVTLSDGSGKTTNNTFTNDTTNWFLGRLTGSTVTSSGQGKRHASVAAIDPPPAPVRIVLTSGTSWTVPIDWNNSNNTVEIVAGGGGGGGGGTSWSGGPSRGGNGAAGTTTCFGTNSSNPCTSPLLSATGGSGGTGCCRSINSSGASGGGGAGSGGTLNTAGNAGSNGNGGTSAYGGAAGTVGGGGDGGGKTVGTVFGGGGGGGGYSKTVTDRDDWRDVLLQHWRRRRWRRRKRGKRCH